MYSSLLNKNFQLLYFALVLSLCLLPHLFYFIFYHVFDHVLKLHYPFTLTLGRYYKSELELKSNLSEILPVKYQVYL